MCWDWRYLGNPVGAPIISVSVSDGEVNSHAAALPFHLKLGDDSYLAVQWPDLKTKSSLRKIGLMNRTASMLESIERKRGVQVDTSFPATPRGYDLVKGRGFTNCPYP